MAFHLPPLSWNCLLFSWSLQKVNLVFFSHLLIFFWIKEAGKWQSTPDSLQSWDTCYAKRLVMLKLSHTKGKEGENIKKKMLQLTLLHKDRQGKGEVCKKTLKMASVLHTHLPPPPHTQFTGLAHLGEMLSSHVHLPNCPQCYHLFHKAFPLSSFLHTPAWKNLLQLSTKENIFQPWELKSCVCMCVLANELKVLREQAPNLTTSLQEMGNQEGQSRRRSHAGRPKTGANYSPSPYSTFSLSQCL